MLIGQHFSVHYVCSFLILPYKKNFSSIIYVEILMGRRKEVNKISSLEKKNLFFVINTYIYTLTKICLKLIILLYGVRKFIISGCFFFFRILVISILICFFMRSKRLTLVLVTFPNNHIEI